jgi:non-ribosomal peptide synthetase component E (peptide arylation enzyme)
VAGAGVVVATGFDPGVFWKRLADAKVAVAALLPEQAEAVLAAAGPEGLDLGRLRLVACGPGQPAPALATAWADRFGLPLFPAGLDAAEPGR